MIKTINYALGSKSYCDYEVKSNPDRNLIMAENITTEDSYMLLDTTGKPSIFGDSIQLSTLNHIGDDKFSGYFYLQAFDLEQEKREMLKEVIPDVLENTHSQFKGYMTNGLLCQRLDHPQTLIMITVWSGRAPFREWLNSDVHKKLDDYTNQQLLNFTELFKVVEKD